METRKGSVLYFLTVVLYLAGVCVQAQEPTTGSTTSQNNATSAAPNATSTNDTTVTPVSTNSSVATSNNATGPVPGGNQTEPSNSTAGNTTSSTPSTQNVNASDQTTPAVTSSTPAPTTTVEPTTVKNFCASISCGNGTCNNTSSNYVCLCFPGFTGDNCESKLVLWPDYSSCPQQTPADSNTVWSSLPFAYFNRASFELIVKSKGYVSFGGDFKSDNMPEGTAWPYAPNLFGIYWSDMEIPNNPNTSFYFCHIERVTSSEMNASTLIEYVKEVVSESSFEPLYLLAATWVDAMPRPAANFSYDKATFQLILASDTRYSYTIRNYQKVWGNVGFYGRPRVSAAYTLENGSKQSLDDIQNQTGKLVTRLFTSGTPTQDPYQCVQKTLNVYSVLNDTVKSLPSCPCHLSQVKADGWFENVNASLPCYQSVLPVRPGLKQQCCYNRFGLLNGNISEASVPVEVNQVNASGVTLQEAHQQCCLVAPQLCRWFYDQFPSSDCSLYTPPYLGSSFGRTYTVTFDNNRYSFNGLGDFVLFKSGEIEVQMKTRRNGDTHTTSIEALAVKIADNTSSFQFYTEGSVIKQNFTASPVTNPDSNTYYNRSNPSSFTLWLPTVIVMVTHMNASLACSIRVNKNDSSSQGLLGSPDGSSANDLRFRNGTSLDKTADQLDISVISEFALSWQVRDANESLFDHPSLPANETANTTAEFTASLLPANVNATLKLFNESVVAEVRQLCREELFCVQEYLISSSNTSALAVLEQANRIFASKEQTSMIAPAFANTEKRININGSSSFSLKLEVQKSLTVTFSTESSFENISGILLDNGTFTWNISANLTVLRNLAYPRNLKFYATSEANLSAEYAPTISLCLCEQPSQCQPASVANDMVVHYSFTDDVTSNGNVNIDLCNCGDRAAGKFCEIGVDVCSNCFDNTTCNATKLTDYCAACPSGFVGDGKYCEDVNECAEKNGGCEHTCTNTNGSFRCTCKNGYKENGTRCIEINECLQDICQDILKVCINEPGSYSCNCISTLVGKDKCIRAPYSFVGSMGLADTGDQAWKSDLNDKKSDYFQQLSGKVSKSIATKLDEENIGKNDTIYVEVLSFGQAANTVRTKRQATSHIIVTFVIYSANNSLTPDVINAILRDGNNTICDVPCTFKGLNITSFPQVNNMANLCNYPEVHKCDMSTTTCEQDKQVTACRCKPGYKPFITDSHTCRDTDECASNATNNCSETEVCINIPGSFTCRCSEGRYWDSNNKTCVANGCASQPCKNGVCYTLQNSTNFACKCNSGWEGSFCETEDAEAYRLKVAVICISVILGVFCLVLLIILIVVCVRQHRNGSDWTLENDSYTNSRYSEAEHLPRVKIAHRPGTEMSENGQGNTYARLSSGSDMSGDKPAYFGQHAPTPDSRGVYQNRAYEEDVGERL